MKVLLLPKYDRPDNAHGGIRRIVEAQLKYLPVHGIEFVDNVVKADLVNTHATEITDVPVNIPWIASCHGLHWSEYNWPQWGARVNYDVVRVLKMADHVTAPSEWVAYALRRGMWLNPTVLHHGIDPDLWEPADNWGYVLWNKARRDAISDPTPIEELAKLAPDIQFISTFGVPSKNLRVSNKMPFEEMREVIRNAGVYLATTRETFGIGTLEAMACAVPVLAWDYGGQSEIIEHKKTGWLAKPGNYRELLEGLRWLIAHKEEVGTAARQAVLDKYTWDKVMVKYAKLYEEVLERHNKLNNAPKVSVISPMYNLGGLLPDMVNSVKDQTTDDWELIIVNDASTDDSLDKAKEIAKSDPRIKVVNSKKNLKLPGALNLGFSKAQGRYVMNLDPDNMIAPTTLKVLSDTLDNDRSIHIAYGRIKFVLNDGITPAVELTKHREGISGWPPEFNCVHQFQHRNQVPSTSLMRREVRERTGGYRDRAKVSEDAEFWTRAVSYGFQPKKVTQSVTLIYRVHSGQKSNSETEPDWTAWMPWTKDYHLTPWGCVALPPKEVGRMWPVSCCDPTYVTVVIPVGPGHEKLVIDALDSVEGQFFKRWHCIVVNDTGKPLKIPHPWATVINTKGKEGPAKARNLGIAMAKTEAIVCLDADDIMQPACLQDMWNIYKEKPQIVYSDWWDDKGDNVSIWHPPLWEPEKLITDGCIFATCAMYPKKYWEEVGGYDENIDIWEDWDFQIALASKGFCAVKIEKPLFTYRKNTGNRRDSFAGKGTELYELGKKMFMAKWPYWNGVGKEKLAMACGGCGKRSVRPATAPKLQQQAQPEGAVLLEFLGKNATAIYVGKGTGTKYRFGNDQSHKRRFVYDKDVPGFLALTGMFRQVPLQPREREDKPTLAGVMEG